MEKKHLQNNILSVPYKREVWHDVLKQIFGVKVIYNPVRNIPLAANDIAKDAVELGNFYTADERLVGVYEITLKADAKTKLAFNKVGLRNLLRSIYKYDVDGALVVFIQGNKWRFSYVSEIRTDEGKKETEPKRYTYLFGKGESCRTAADRFNKLKGNPIYLNDLFEAFNVEKLNKEFFRTYKEFYQKGVAEIIERKPFYKLLIDKTQEHEEKKEKPIRDFVKKMLGRIVFLHFLQKKGWMGVDAGNKAWDGGDIQFLQTLFANQKQKEKFLTTALRTLFFETLNTKRKNDLAPSSLGAGIKLPYLNGGLFDKDNSFYNDIDFTADYFKNLLEFFEQYNFTIDENDPYDNEVGIDPEMLGHIFENLLEENKDKGAFYTPKEVVHYMCQESLIQYLRANLPECTEDESPATIALQSFIRSGIIGERIDKKNFVVQQGKRIEKLLDRVKICDPAIGSGAFPMGMLQEIYKAKINLDLTLDHTEVKKQIIQNCIYGVDIENGAVEIARLRFWLALVVDETIPNPLPNLDYKIMQGNSLLESFEGVDLSNLADMEKEETFLSASKQQLELGADFSLKKQSMLVFDQKSKTQLYDLISDYYNYDETTNTKYKSKQFIKDEINGIVEGKLLAKFYLQKPKQEQKIKDIHNAIKANRLMAADAPGVRLRKEKNLEKLNKELIDKETELERLNSIIEQLHELQTRTDKPYFLWHLWFKDVFDKGGFDIVIGNPPYIDIKKLDKETVRMLFNNFKTTTNRANIYSAFIEFSLGLINQKGTLTFIVPNSLLVNDSYAKVREALLSELKIVVKTPDSTFESAVVETIIFLLSKGTPSEFIKGKQFGHEEKIKLDEINFNLFNRKNWAADSLKRFNIFSDQNSLNLLLKIEESELTFDSEFDYSLGITPYDKYKGHTEEMIENRVYHSEKKLDKTYVPLIAGDNIQRFVIDGKIKEYLKYGEWLGAPREPRFFKEDKVVVRQILSGNALAITSAYSETELYFTQIGFSIIQKNKNSSSLKVLVAYLNSKLISFYHKYKYLDIEKVVFPKILIANCKKFPLPRKNLNYKINIEKLVEKVIQLKKDKLPTSNYENKIDALVFHLYKLTESEILQVLDTFKDLSIKDRNQIQNEYWNITNNKFQLEA